MDRSRVVHVRMDLGLFGGVTALLSNQRELNLVKRKCFSRLRRSKKSTCGRFAGLQLTLNMWRIFRFQSPCFKCSAAFSRQIVTVQEVRTYQEQGVVCLRGVFGEWIERLTKGIARNRANPSQFSEWLRAEDSKSFYFNDFLNWRQIPEFEEFVYGSPAGEIAGKLMEAEVRMLNSLL